ncbi:MAG: hypothetical protein QM689_12720 [Oscillospiraceae bacterium]
MMLKKNRLDVQMFNNGVVEIYGVSNSAADGNMPVSVRTIKMRLCFSRRTVGVNRYNLGMQNNVQIDELIRCQLRENVSTQDIAVIGDKQYTIKQIQYPDGVTPPCMDLSLSRLEADYDNT